MKKNTLKHRKGSWFLKQLSQFWKQGHWFPVSWVLWTALAQIEDAMICHSKDSYRHVEGQYVHFYKMPELWKYNQIKRKWLLSLRLKMCKSCGDIALHIHSLCTM
jgi:hypothetical protein